jgi:hypothetical protein
LVRERANGCCEYCLSQARFSPDPFSIEHIVSRAKGGNDDLENLAFSCQGCNGLKHTHTEWIDFLTETNMPLFHPRIDSWNEHFRWDESQTLIIPLTGVGRATLEKLKLNREELVLLRRALLLAGEHPPR